MFKKKIKNPYNNKYSDLVVDRAFSSTGYIPVSARGSAHHSIKYTLNSFRVCLKRKA